MRSLLLLIALVPSVAQDLTQNPTAAPAPAPTAASNQPPAAAQPSPVPSGEPWINGYIDLGYRWLIGPAGSLDTYRSIINLGSGPKLLGADFTLIDPKHRLFDKIRVQATTWGDEPYETLHLDASKSKIYEFNADYRDFAYFNNLPSYADPLLGRGIELDEQAFDTRRRLASFDLDVLPQSWITPYVGFSRDSESGAGTTVFVSDVSTNQFPVPDTQADFTNLYRGGLRFKFKRFHVTVEEGATSYHSSENIYQSPSSPLNYGDTLAPSFGQSVYLSSLLAGYGITGSSNYTKALFTANATSWLDVYGQFLYSEPSATVNYSQSDTGNLLLQSQILFYTSQEFLLDAAAKLPQTTGSIGAEIRPMKRVRITETWLTDRMHNASNATSNNLLNTTPSEQIAAELSASLVNNYNQNEIDVFYDATNKLMLRGGYRYVWGEADDAILPPEGLASSDIGMLHRNVALGGFRYRPIQRLTISAETEVASSTGDYFRTSLYNYQKVRGQVRYQATKSLSFAGDVMVLDNSNPVPTVNYSFNSRQESASLFWAPKDGKYFDFEGSYTRSAIRSDIGYLLPATLGPQTSLYVDNAHIGTGMLNFKLPHSGWFTPKLSAGGSFFISSGSRPTSYYQPLATLWLPLGKHVSWFTQWTYYGYGEAFYLYEGFRAHLVTTGLRISR
jgi:hypothetical protein